jgi:membrane-bound metal-dependent hydrolase YbcI (DUF457 family)
MSNNHMKCAVNKAIYKITNRNTVNRRHETNTLFANMIRMIPMKPVASESTRNVRNFVPRGRAAGDHLNISKLLMTHSLTASNSVSDASS